MQVQETVIRSSTQLREKRVKSSLSANQQVAEVKYLNDITTAKNVTDGM